MRTLPRVFCCVLAACTPEVAPVVEPAPVEQTPVQPRDYDVLLDVTEDLRVRARMFPDAPITAVEVLAFASAGAAPVTAWKAEQGGDAAPVSAGSALELGALPSGWIEVAPFLAPASGATWVVTLKTADGEGRSTRFLSDTRVQPTLRVDRGDGLFVVETVPAVPVSRVTLRGADAGVLWEGRAPAENVTLPSGGLVVGDAPLTWDARRFPTGANLVSGQRYTIEVATAGALLSTEALFLAGQSAVIAPISSIPVAHPLHEAGGSWTMGRVFETRDGAVAGFRAVPSLAWGVPTFYAVHPSSSGRVVLDATPFTQDIGPAYMATLAPARTLWAMSRIVPTEKHRVGFAAVYSSNRTTPGRVFVVERPEWLPSTLPTYWFEDAWIVHGQPVGPALNSTDEVSVHLARGVVTGLAQHAKSPWIVSITNRSKPADFTLAALDTNSAWVTLGATGLSADGDTLNAVTRLRHLVGGDGKLYALAVVKSTSAGQPLVETVLARYEPSMSRWTRLHAFVCSNWAETDDRMGFNLLERDGVIWAGSLAIEGNFAVYRVLRRDADGSIADRVFTFGGGGSPVELPAAPRDLGLDAKGRLLLLTMSEQGYSPNEPGRRPAMSVWVVSSDRDGLGVAQVASVSPPLTMPLAPEGGSAFIVDFAFGQNGRGVNLLQGSATRDGSYTFERSMLWRLPLSP